MGEGDPPIPLRLMNTPGRSARGCGNSTRTSGNLSMPYGRPPNRVGTTGYMDYSPCPEQRSDACSDVDRCSAHWLHFTRKIKDAENHTKYKCLWQQDVGVICTYVAKRQLVKRHIEDRHMGLRPFTCSYCDQAFAQRSNMNTHINTKHTGEQPHVCPEPDCPKKFGDPARLLRHRTDAHGYIPKRSSKKQRPLPVQSKDAQSRYETEYPWRLVAGTSASYGSVN
ncbi:hypothetical protein FISHEDRAFT_62397 [Fistulina hepatica ATCC 64428]|nr:hypothetical protein FISHEDRAFT_62397 [Fistulina hepatica ATCC 64428]